MLRSSDVAIPLHDQRAIRTPIEITMDGGVSVHFNITFAGDTDIAINIGRTLELIGGVGRDNASPREKAPQRNRSPISGKVVSRLARALSAPTQHNPVKTAGKSQLLPMNLI
jgi:hypothetical protein